MVKTQRIVQNRLVETRVPAVFLFLLFLPLLVIALLGIDHLYRPVPEHRPGLTMIAYELPAVPYNMSVKADGSVQVTVPTDNVGMPTPPNCKDLGLSEECKWKMKWAREPGKTRFDFIEVELRSGKDWVVSKIQLVEIDLAEVQQVAGIETAGHQTGWIAHIQVASKFLGNGVGRLTWQAGDAALKIWAGANGANSVIRVVADTAGWGSAIMAKVPAEAIIFADDPIWVYLVERG